MSGLQEKVSRRDLLKPAAATLTAGFFARPAEGAPAKGDLAIASDGKARAAIVIGRGDRKFDRWLAGELRHYVQLLSGAELPITTAGENSPLPLRILIGGPAANENVATAQKTGAVNFRGLKQDGFLLQQIELDARPALVAGGNDDAATMYAVYELIERLGVVFQITGEIIPERRKDLRLPPLQVKMEPVLKYRGLHVRHFVMPWMGMDDFRLLLGQLARMKCNYLEFYWYVGAPWTEYSYRGEKRMIGDVYTRESGYATWRINTATFTPADVKIGRDRFRGPRFAAPELQDCETQEEAHRAARKLLGDVIRFAHERKIQVWLGEGDCPLVTPNLGRFARYGRRTNYGIVVPPGDPIGVEIWTASMNSMIETYPEADGYWLWLAEGYFYHEDAETKAVLRPYERYAKPIPSLEEIRKVGYDQYLRGMSQEKQRESDLSLLFYGKEVSDRVRKAHPKVRLGVSLLGRAYLFAAMDALFPKDVLFQSMEASICWNRSSRVPMQLFGGMGERERLLVPRLDDDESEFAMQFNVGLYHHDQVIEGSVANGVAGVAPQTGKLRGLEQNARYVFDGGWNAAIAPGAFYREYVERIYGKDARETMFKAYDTFEALEMFLGLKATKGHFLGLNNFLNYADSRDIRMLGQFARQKDPFDGPDFNDWDVRKEGASPWIESCSYRRDRFAEGIVQLEQGLGYLEQARGEVSPGARGELAYIAYKTRSYIGHLETIRALLAFYLAYDQAFRAKLKGDTKRLMQELDASEFHYAQARDLVRETTRMVAENSADPTEAYILFRYNVRFLNPIDEFGKFVRNVVNFHHGQPYWERVDWEIIAPTRLV